MKVIVNSSPRDILLHTFPLNLCRLSFLKIFLVIFASLLKGVFKINKVKIDVKCYTSR